MMRTGIAADHGGCKLKVQLTAALTAAGEVVADFGAHELVGGDDSPDCMVRLARAVARGEVSRGLAMCGSGVGAYVAANKVPGVRAALIAVYGLFITPLGGVGHCSFGSMRWRGSSGMTA